MLSWFVYRGSSSVSPFLPLTTAVFVYLRPFSSLKSTSIRQGGPCTRPRMFFCAVVTTADSTGSRGLLDPSRCWHHAAFTKPSPNSLLKVTHHLNASPLYAMIVEYVLKWSLFHGSQGRRLGQWGLDRDLALTLKNTEATARTV